MPDERLYRTQGTDKSIIHCIGDSHAFFFSGKNRIQPEWPEPSEDSIPFFKSYRLGPVLAHNLAVNHSTSKGREKLFSLLDQLPPPKNIMLCFGEIDCRAHILKQSELQQKEPEEIIGITVARYFSVVTEIKNMGYKLLLWNVIPSSPDDKIINPDYPVFGSCLERNRITRKFNKILENLALEENIPFISIFDQLIDAKGLSKKIYYMDPVHLSQRAMPLLIKEMKRKFPDIDFSGYRNFNWERYGVYKLLSLFERLLGCS